MTRELQARLGHRFRDPALLERALTHSSYVHEGKRDGRTHYERLEFLGDALLGMLVAEWLWREDAGADEGTLTRRKQAVVRTAALARTAAALGLGRELRLGRGEEATGGRTKGSILADVFEAVLAAVYLDGGIRSARAFVRRHLKGPVRAACAVASDREDAKTLLQETAQGRWRTTPHYRIVSADGPSHARTFTAEVLLGEEVAGSGQGPSRKEAEQEAARSALTRVEDPTA